MKIKDVKVNQKSEFTRRCIGEAVLKLLDSNEFSKLKVSEIAKRAGVSRTTFYQYYSSPYSRLRYQSHSIDLPQVVHRLLQAATHNSGY